MPAIRNSAVAKGIIADTALHVVYTVPANNNFILKSVLTNQQSGVAVTVSFFLHDAGTGAYILGAVVSDVAGQPGSWSGWVVLNAGDQILAQPTVANTNYWISGAVLPFVGAGP